MAKKTNIKTLPLARQEELIEHLQSGEPLDSSLSMVADEVGPLCDHLVETRSVELLARLSEVVTEKKAIKAVNKALFRLRQLGIAVEAKKLRTAGIQLTVEDDPLEALMLGMSANGACMLLFAHLSGQSLRMANIAFDGPTGVKELWSRSVSRSEYRKAFSEVRSIESESPYDESVLVSPQMIERKLWCLQRHLRSGRTGTEIDRELIAELRFPTAEPRHPAADLSFDECRALQIAEILEQPHLWLPLVDDKVVSELDGRLTELDESPLILSGSTEVSRRYGLIDDAVESMINSWTLSGLTETFLDLSYRLFLVDLRDEALTLYQVVESADEVTRRRSLVEFLSALLDGAFSQLTEEDPEEESTSKGGIILP